MALALIGAGFIAVVMACGALWNALEQGLFIDHALAAASHQIHSVNAGVVGDVFLY